MVRRRVSRRNSKRTDDDFRRRWNKDVKTTMIYTHVVNRGCGVRSPADALNEGMAWNDMRNPDKVPGVFDPVEKLVTENE